MAVTYNVRRKVPFVCLHVVAVYILQVILVYLFSLKRLGPLAHNLG